MTPEEFARLLRDELPRLLKEHPEARHEIWGILLEVFPSREEFIRLLEAIQALREDATQRFEAIDRRFEAIDKRFEAIDRRFEAIDRRFEAIDRRFEAMIAEMRQLREDMDRRFEAVNLRLERVEQLGHELRVVVSSLGGRVGYGLEHAIRKVVEEFSGQLFSRVERLILIDTEGEVYGIKGAEVEFDLYATDGVAYLVEVKSHVETGDVLDFHRKAEFARRKLGAIFTRLIIALSMEARAERLMQDLGIKYLIRARLD